MNFLNKSKNGNNTPAAAAAAPAGGAGNDDENPKESEAENAVNSVVCLWEKCVFTS